MENERALDEKTAKLIAEMDKSLQNMERSLGPEHPVIAKILDSYAKLLRQNNLRHLDAVNMEARAKAIRAKHNQKEAEEQAKDLEPLVHHKKSVSTGQIRAFVWSISILVLLVVSAATVQIIRTGLPQTSSAIVKKKLEIDQMARNEISTVYEDRDPETGELVSKTTITNEPAEPKQVTIFEVAGKLMQIKKLAKTKLKEGLKAEKSKDFETATNAYKTIVDAVESATKSFGRQAHSEEIAQCYSGYARMLELNGSSDLASQYEKEANYIRAQSK